MKVYEVVLFSSVFPHAAVVALTTMSNSAFRRPNISAVRTSVTLGQCWLTVAAQRHTNSPDKFDIFISRNEVMDATSRDSHCEICIARCEIASNQVFALTLYIILSRDFVNHFLCERTFKKYKGRVFFSPVTFKFYVTGVGKLTVAVLLHYWTQTRWINYKMIPVSEACLTELTPLASCQVIIKLSDQVTACMSNPCPSVSSSGSGSDSQTFKQLKQQIENLKVNWSWHFQNRQTENIHMW